MLKKFKVEFEKLNGVLKKLKTGFNRGEKNLNLEFRNLNVKLKNLNVKIFVIVTVLMMVLFPAGEVFAKLSESQVNSFSQNDILFYDPTGIDCYSGNLSGNTIMAKIVNYLKGNNPTGFMLSDNGVAGVLANFQGESGFNPFRYQGDTLAGPAYGVAQFDPMDKIHGPLKTDSRTASYFNEYIDLKYTRYDATTGLPVEPVPMGVVDAWLLVQLDFFFGASSEFENTRVGSYRNLGGEMGLNYITDSMTVHEALEAAVTPEDATRIFVWIMERPADKEGAATGRSANAQTWLSYVRSMAGMGAETNASSTADGSNVTIIGDSITNGTRAELEQALPGVDIYAQDSKQFYLGTDANPGGITILRELVESGKLRGTLVYALGTNGTFTAAQAQEVVDLAAGKTVVFVTNYSTSNSFLTNNNVMAKMKNENSNVYIADWKAAVESHPDDFLAGDGVHPKEAGRELFASVIANTIGGVGKMITTCGLGAVNGGISEAQAQALLSYYQSDEVDASVFYKGTKENCVAFSQFFVQWFTSAIWAGGNGRDVAHNLAVKNSLPEGKEPRPFSIFSVTKGVTECGEELCGHTGVVVAVNGSDIMTIEAAWEGHDGKIVHRTIDYFENTVYGNTFVYLDSVLDLNKLSGIVGS